MATKNGHVEIVKLLLEHNCSRTILNRSGKVAFEEAATPTMQRPFIRSEDSDRFHESNANRSIAHYLPKDNERTPITSRKNTTRSETNKPNNETDEPSKETNTTTNKALEFYQQFETEDDVYEYSLNHQTTAMWLRFYNWFSRTFPSFFQHDGLHIDSFDLHKNNDFKLFLQQKLGNKYQETLDEFNKAEKHNSIVPLLKVYSSEKYGFYQSLNKQLAASPAEAETSPHLCDRFIIEFHIRGDELARRAFCGIVYRGATINSDELPLYEKVCKNEPRGVIAFKAFTSTSEDKNVALQFISPKSLQAHQIAVLFIIDVKVKSPTIMGIADVSDYTHEKEILFMPGNLFVVKKIVKDVPTETLFSKAITLTKIHLEYLHIPVSFRKKLLHTYRSARKNSVT